MSTYEKQASDFLAKTGTTCTVTFSKHGKHFADDTESRDIFTLTLARGTRTYTTEFGQSLNDSTGDGSIPPCNYSILSCLEKYPTESFEDWCEACGYDTDSRKAFPTYESCKREYEGLERLFTDVELDELREIQ